jgi:GTP-binding protein Era
VIDAAKGINRGIEDIVMRLKDRREAKILVLNKVDIAKKDELLALAAAMNQRIDFTDIFMVSATTGDGIADLKARWRRGCRKGRGCSRGPGIRRHRPHAGAEVTREQLFVRLHAELPYASAVETEKYEERKDGSVAIHQQILVGRPTQKASCSARAAR